MTACQSPEPARKASQVEGCQNVQRLEDQLYSGGQPHGQEAFKALADLGIKTIISVDGAQPQIEEAKRCGIRTVHLPIGYDGIPEKRGLEIARAVRDLPGPIYVHCHHGQHRGPAAAAFAAIAIKGWSRDRALAYMKRAGTSKTYKGLYHSVLSLKVPSKSRINKADNRFPSLAELPNLTRTMALIDRRYGHLKEVRAAAWRVPQNHPDIEPKHEALQLRELLVELERSQDSQNRSVDYKKRLKACIRAAQDLETSLLKGDKQAAEFSYTRLQLSCRECHQQYRNQLVR